MTDSPGRLAPPRSLGRQPPPGRWAVASLALGAVLGRSSGDCRQQVYSVLVRPFGTVDSARPAATLEIAVRACALASLGSPSPLPRTARRRTCAQSARDFPAPSALSPHRGGRCRPSCAPSGRSPEVVRPRPRRAEGRPSRPSARLSSFRSTRSRTWMAAWPLGSAPGTAAVAVERVSSGGRATGSRSSSGRAQRRICGVSTARRRPRRSARPSRICGPPTGRRPQPYVAGLWRSVEDGGTR